MSQVTLSYPSTTNIGKYSADRSLSIDDGYVEVLTWDATGNFNLGLAVPCDQQSPEAVFLKTGIAKAKRGLLSDVVISIMKTVIRYCCVDEHFGSCVRTDPGRIVGQFINEIMRFKILVGIRHPSNVLDAGILADPDIETGIIWFNQSIVQSAVEYMRKTRRGGVANATSENHLYMAVVVPAIHGWSRLLARRITQGHFDQLPREPGRSQAASSRFERAAREVLQRRLYTFCPADDDPVENAAWLARAFGDYVVDILFGGEFAIYMQNRSPSHPAEFPVVCRNPCDEPHIQKFVRLRWDTVDEICETPDWPLMRGKRRAHIPGRFQHDHPRYRLVGELDTVRRRRASGPWWSQQIVDRACERERGEGGSGWDWAREMFPDCEIPGPEEGEGEGREEEEEKEGEEKEKEKEEEDKEEEEDEEEEEEEEDFW
ncbi:hypothetical protein F5X96DRAFT_693519 [Biscogniauxia mediterranea]|nr:hypothetical protein F5X96DRAFT_693519 [Biscogniauxia mediterranea]